MGAVDLALPLIGGLAFFLYGMDLLSVALRAAAGERLRRALGLLTRNRTASTVSGVLVTAAVQSSSVTSVLVAGFISAGLLELTPAVGLLIGGKLGSTVTAQVIAFKVTRYALLAVAAGFALRLLARREALRQAGLFVLGIGLVFYGMDLMSQAFAPFKDSAALREWLAHADAPALGVAAGALITGLIQSSAATIGIILVLAGQGLVSPAGGVAVAVGATIGTCVTGLLAAIGKPRAAVRAMVFHILFATVAALLWCPLLPAFTGLVARISPAGDGPRLIANAVSLYALANLLWATPLAPLWARLMLRLLPEPPRPADGLEVAPAHLEATWLNDPVVALENVRRELGRMAGVVAEMLAAVAREFDDAGTGAVRRIASGEEGIDRLHTDLIAYLRRLAQRRLSEADTRRLAALLAIANQLENASDLIHDELAGVRRTCDEKGVAMSAATRERVRGLAVVVGEAMATAGRCLGSRDPALVEVVNNLKKPVKKAIDEVSAHLSSRLLVDAPGRLDLFRIESDLVEHLRHVYYVARRIARTTRQLD